MSFFLLLYAKHRTKWISCVSHHNLFTQLHINIYRIIGKKAPAVNNIDIYITESFLNKTYESCSQVIAYSYKQMRKRWRVSFFRNFSPLRQCVNWNSNLLIFFFSLCIICSVLFHMWCTNALIWGYSQQQQQQQKHLPYPVNENIGDISIIWPISNGFDMRWMGSIKMFGKKMVRIYGRCR